MKHSKSAQLETAPTGLCISPVHCEESGQDAPPTVWWLNPLSPPCQGEVICIGAGMPLLRVFCTFFLHELIRLMLTVYRRFGP